MHNNPIAPDGLYYGHKIKAPYIVTREGDGS